MHGGTALINKLILLFFCLQIEKSEESSFGMKSSVSLLDQHTELKKIAEGLSSKWAAVASTVHSCRFCCRLL